MNLARLSLSPQTSFFSPVGPAAVSTCTGTRIWVAVSYDWTGDERLDDAGPIEEDEELICHATEDRLEWFPKAFVAIPGRFADCTGLFAMVWDTQVHGPKLTPVNHILTRQVRQKRAGNRGDSRAAVDDTVGLVLDAFPIVRLGERGQRGLLEIDRTDTVALSGVYKVDIDVIQYALGGATPLAA
ncbi:hypothetical protein FRC12_008014 [Ceratobasidium sp. 428]|nr:hypothetical protein FRC12_008014 [Ceratobasidium sp. 428]